MFLQQGGYSHEKQIRKSSFKADILLPVHDHQDSRDEISPQKSCYFRLDFFFQNCAGKPGIVKEFHCSKYSPTRGLVIDYRGVKRNILN